MKNNLLKALPLCVLAIVGCGKNDDSSEKPKAPMSDSQLEQILMQRYDGDRTGVCVAAAFIEKQHVARASVCAVPSKTRLNTQTDALEIGSVTKTMTATMLASLIDEGKISLEDPLSMHVPETVHVPNYQGKPILIKHLVTHTSGLPPDPMNYTNDNPFGTTTEANILEELNAASLTRAPGSEWEYSKYAYMLLGYIISNLSGTDLETMMNEKIFSPLNMQHSYIQQLPADTTAVTGHQSNTKLQADNLDFTSVNLSGAGGARSTLDDMVLYAQALLGDGDANTVNLLKQTQQQVDIGPEYPADSFPMGMAWILLPDGMFFHDGNTLGFSSLLLVDPVNKQAFVILEDTRYEAGRYAIANYLFGASQELPPPKLEAVPDDALLQALQGDYIVNGDQINLSYSGKTLIATLADGSTIDLKYDNYGDFYSVAEEIGLVTPIKDSAGNQVFAWNYLGAVFIAERLNP